MPHKFDPKNIHKLEELIRLMPPYEIFQLINLREGDIFLDIGAGPGRFSFPAAKIVGSSGKVIAVDVSREILDHLAARINESGVKNIELIHSDENDLRVPDQTADVSFLCMVLHEVDKPLIFLKEVHRATMKGGKIVIIEWAKKPMEKGPPPEDRMEPDHVIEFLQKAGFHNVSGNELHEYFFFLIGTK